MANSTGMKPTFSCSAANLSAGPGNLVMKAVCTGSSHFHFHCCQSNQVIMCLACAVLCLIAQSCRTLFNSRDCSPPGSSICRDSPGRNTGGGCHVLLQGIFPTQGLNPGLLHCKRILYHPFFTREAQEY